MTPSDVRDRRPTGRPPPPGPSRGGVPAACALLSAAKAPRALSRRRRGPRLRGRVRGSRGGDAGGVPVPQDPGPRAPHAPAPVAGPCRVLAPGRQEGTQRLGDQGQSHQAASQGSVGPWSDPGPAAGAWRVPLPRGWRKSLRDPQPQVGGCR